MLQFLRFMDSDTEPKRCADVQRGVIGWALWRERINRHGSFSQAGSDTNLTLGRAVELARLWVDKGKLA